MGTKGENKNLFRQAVESVPEIQAGFRNGLQALGANAKAVKTEDTRKLEGSVDIDACTKALYPEDSRWDYAIGYDAEAYFLEVHPANTSNVDDMVKKAEWLTNWLKEKAPALKRMASSNTFYWVPSGKYNILPHAPQSRRLAQKHVRIVSILRLPVPK